MLASTFGNNQFGLDGTLLIGKRVSLNPNYTGPIAGSGDNIIIGQDLNLINGTDTNNTQDCVFIGSTWTYAPGSNSGMGQSVIIGTECQCSTTSYPSHVTIIGNNASAIGADVTDSTIIGCSAISNTTGAVAIGHLSKVQNSRGVSIGTGANATGLGDNIAIGYGARDNGNTNTIVIGSSNVLSAGRNNAVVIGNSSQSDVVIGQFSIGISTGKTVKVNDASYVMASSDGTVMMTAITAARTITLPSAASVPSGYIVRGVDASGSASGSNTITFAPSGADAIVGPGTSVISNAYSGCKFISDGVSKWINSNGY
jgi:hypothetical protein